MAAKDFVIESLRGGLNEDPPFFIDDDQCTIAENVEFDLSTVGERRKGYNDISLTSMSFATVSVDRIAYLFRHLPGADGTTSELWAVKVRDTSAMSFYYKDTVWNTTTITPADTPANLTGVARWNVSMASLHGKLFISYNAGSVDRLHVRDAGTAVIRRVGLATPSAPTAANDGGVGTFSGTRYGRVRMVVQASSVTIRRSEPSTALSFAPNGNDTGITWTKPTTIEDATHWEIELSVDNANFYRMATIAVGTTTHADTVVYATGYATTGTLSADSGDYTVPGNFRYLAVDEDRLLMATSRVTAGQGSRVMWTTVTGDVGVGNDERVPTDTTNFLDLDALDGGNFTGMLATAQGYVYLWKAERIYKLVRTGVRDRAYEAVTLSKTVGGLEGSMVEGFDQFGRPCVYAADPLTGPYRIGADGIQSMSRDIRKATWRRVNLNAANMVCRGLFLPDKRQVKWFLAVDSGDFPNFCITCQVNELRETPDGLRRGWSTSGATYPSVISAVMYAANVDVAAARSLLLLPLVGVATSVGDHGIFQGENGDDDDGVAFSARIRSKPFVLAGLLNKFGAMVGAVMAKATSTADVIVGFRRDFGLGTKDVTVSLDASAAAETHVVKLIDELAMSECRCLQAEFRDVGTPTTQWELHRFDLKLRSEDRA